MIITIKRCPQKIDRGLEFQAETDLIDINNIGCGRTPEEALGHLVFQLVEFGFHDIHIIIGE